MKWLSFVATGLLTAALLVNGTGCSKGEKKTGEGEGGKKLSVRAPGDTSVKPGETATINIDITREKFNDPVELKFTGLPDGVSIMENDLTISKDASSTKLTLKAATDAKPVDDHKVTVTASGGGMKLEATFKVTVKKGADTAKKLTLKAPANTSVKQGETATINVGITRDKFNDPVELKFAGLPEGVSILENDLTISKDATSAKLTLKAADNAKVVDDHKVTVTASGGGLTQEATFQVAVTLKAADKKEADTAKKLTLKAPANISVKQGETATINVDITREKFNDPVELKFAGLPEGVSILENDLTLSKDATRAKLTLKAADTARVVDDHQVTVTASGGGITQEATFKVTIKKKS